MEEKHILMSILRGGLISWRRIFGLSFFFFLPATSFAAFQIAPPFWASKIDSGFQKRDIYYRSVLPDTSNYSLILLNPIQRQLLCDRIATNPDTLSPWYHFIKGILECGKQKTVGSTHFAAALALAKQDPGTTWALFVEFTRNRQPLWAERCLMLLEKLFLASGASRAPAITQQLLFFAHQDEKGKDLSAAFSYYAWAERFDPDQIWSGLHRLRNCIPSHSQLFFATLSILFNKFMRSWQLQLEIFSQVQEWSRIFLLIALIAIIVGLGFKYASPASHPIIDRLPESVPAAVKSCLAFGTVVSFISFGLYPFLWLVSFCIWRFLERREKVLMTVALVFLTATPFSARVQDMFLQARSLEGSLMLYSRAAREGYQSELHQLALKKIIIDPSDALAHLAASLYASKIGDTAAARLNVKKALDLKPGNRLILTHMGNIEYLAGNTSAAVAWYQQVLTTFPDDMVSRFNLSQCYARTSDTTMDLDFMKIIDKKEQSIINDFINANNVYFSKNWPPLRQIMNPDYSVREFWLTEFKVNSGSWKTTRTLWGASFLGVSPRLSLIIFIMLFIVLVAWGLTPGSRKRARKIAECRLCGRAICKECAKGELCPSCSQTTQFIRNVKTLAATQSKIVRRRQLLKGLEEQLLDIALPGTGMLFRGKAGLIIAVPIIMLTAVVYALFSMLTELHLHYPHWVAYGIMERVPYFLFCYNGLFALRAAYILMSKKEKKIA
jgi:tetratricopeptide (TPR) repeat protein